MTAVAKGLHTLPLCAYCCNRHREGRRIEVAVDTGVWQLLRYTGNAARNVVGVKNWGQNVGTDICWEARAQSSDSIDDPAAHKDVKNTSMVCEHLIFAERQFVA